MFPASFRADRPWGRTSHCRWIYCATSGYGSGAWKVAAEGAVLLALPTRRHSRSSGAVDDALGKVPTRSAWLVTVVAAPRRRSLCSVESANPCRFRSTRADCSAMNGQTARAAIARTTQNSRCHTTKCVDWTVVCLDEHSGRSESVVDESQQQQRWQAVGKLGHTRRRSCRSDCRPS